MGADPAAVTHERIPPIPRTKIVCTLGPATDSSEAVASLVRAGASVARLNLAHGTPDEHVRRVRTVRDAASDLGLPVALMIDIPGPKYRIGELAAGGIDLRLGDVITLTGREVRGEGSTVPVRPPGIQLDARPGRLVAVSDGLVQLRVTAVSGEDVTCEALTPGRLTRGRGVSVPGHSSARPASWETTRRGLSFAAQQGADFVALSSVRTAREVRDAREALRDCGGGAAILSKIETAEAVDNFDSILAESDAVMVARGDLGVEVRLAEVPAIQKRLIRSCNAAGKPVITATQMLESMVDSPSPTRAEVTDVANAVFDGSDAIMLSAETAIGAYPERSVRVMAEVAVEAEAALPYESLLLDKRSDLVSQTDDAIAYSACRTARQIGAGLICAFTESGSTAGRVSKYRPEAQILALTPSDETQRALTLNWGVLPVTTGPVTSVDGFFDRVQEQAALVPGVGPGSLVVLVAGLPIGVRGGTNLLRVLSLD